MLIKKTDSTPPNTTTPSPPLSEKEQEQQLNIINLSKKFSGLGLLARFKDITEGPVVTSYSFQLDSSVPVSKVTSKTEDFAMSVGADKVLVQRIGGEIHVFIPNKERRIVDFKENLHWLLNTGGVDESGNKVFKIPIPVGCDTMGNKHCFDLIHMPHCLIAGSTGAGKSVFEASIISSNSYYNSPADLSIYLVDTKRVDLPLFSSLPHVKACADSITSFHTDVADSIMTQTRERLQTFQNMSCRNISEYNGMGYNMPYILVMIDELGDLLDLDRALDRRKDGMYEGVPTVKAWLAQITRISRAAGVHIIACTQRSSVKVVDGDIKANLPCRIALRLPTGTDSRTIIGQNGAENLLGKGDMLIVRPDQDIPLRYHGPFVSMNDITELVNNYDQLKDILHVSR